MPMKVGEIVTVAGRPSQTLKPAPQFSILKQAGDLERTPMKGYVVVFEGDDESGYSAYSPDLPGVVAAGATRSETDRLMREAMAEHISLLRQRGDEVPEPSDIAEVTVVNPPAA
jgi:predicted RNase H-like HicB family nuclease